MNIDILNYTISELNTIFLIENLKNTHTATQKTKSRTRQITLQDMLKYIIKYSEKGTLQDAIVDKLNKGKYIASKSSFERKFMSTSVEFFINESQIRNVL